MEIIKGTITSVENGTVRVVRNTADQVVTRPLVIPGYMVGTCRLTVGVDVFAAVADDGTGLVLARADGDWHPTFLEDVTAEGISLESHTHAGVHGQTGGAN